MQHLFLIAAVSITLQAFAQDSHNSPFKDCKVNGSTTIYDYKLNEWFYTDQKDSEVATLPASTFKILNTLIALETGVIASENEVIKWPGKTDSAKYGNRPDIYRDMTVKEAFKVSAVWVYLELANRIGKEHYKDFLAKTGYGNQDISINDIDFWNFGELSISSVDQINFLRSLYDESLPFSKRSIAIVKELMLEEQSQNYSLRAKTGWTRKNGKDIGWWVGYIETQNNVYFFATKITKDENVQNSDFGNCRKKITKTIFKQLKITE